MLFLLIVSMELTHLGGTVDIKIITFIKTL